MGYRLITEYFVFPEKFMFIDLSGLAGKIPGNAGNQLDFYLYLDTSDVELEHNISSQTFTLGCTPVINLFNHKADPVKLDHRQLEYQVIADVRRPAGLEVYSVDRVMATSSEDDREEVYPFYGLKHEHQNSEQLAYWFASRKDSRMSSYHRDEGSDVFLSLVDLHFNPNIPEDRTLIISTTCSNRDLPEKLPFTANQPKLQCVDSAPPCSMIRCLTQPTKTVRAPLGNQARWRLISHLNLNHLSLTGGDDATLALKEILRLYDFNESSVTAALIESITRISARQISAPLPIDGRATMCRGIEIELEIDDTLLTGSSVYLFVTILEHFFGLYCSINSFTRVLIKLKTKEGYFKKCPPRAGEKILL